jgi:hypothetical protein
MVPLGVEGIKGRVWRVLVNFSVSMPPKRRLPVEEETSFR